MSDKKEPKKNCYIYTRVSTDLQVEEGYSLDEQDRRLHDEAKRRNFFVADKFSDEGVSGKNTVDREGYIWAFNQTASAQSVAWIL